jgi:hypothetical protein
MEIAMLLGLVAFVERLNGDDILNPSLQAG